jgi:hypothetical protein
MRESHPSRRTVLKRIGAAGTVGVLSTATAGTATAADYDISIWLTKDAKETNGSYYVNDTMSRTILDAFPGSMQVNWNGGDPFDASNASSLSEVEQQFESWLSTQDAAADSNVLAVRRANFSGLYEAEQGNNVAVTNGADLFAELDEVANEGTSTTYKHLYFMLFGLGLNLGSTGGDGLIVKDSTNSTTYTRTPMAGFYTNGDGQQGTNSCGDTIYETNKYGTFDLSYSDCALNKMG